MLTEKQKSELIEAANDSLKKGVKDYTYGIALLEEVIIQKVYGENLAKLREGIRIVRKIGHDKWGQDKEWGITNFEKSVSMWRNSIRYSIEAGDEPKKSVFAEKIDSIFKKKATPIILFILFVIAIIILIYLIKNK